MKKIKELCKSEGMNGAKIMRTNKQRAIAAVKEIIHKYRHPHGKKFFSCEGCALCDIFCNGFSCTPCPLNIWIYPVKGCTSFYTFASALAVYQKNRETIISGNLVFVGFPVGLCNPREFITRAKFFELALPKLEALPPEAFTKKGYHIDNFRFLEEIDAELSRGTTGDNEED